MQESFWWWQCSYIYIYIPFPQPPHLLPISNKPYSFCGCLSNMFTYNQNARLYVLIPSIKYLSQNVTWRWLKNVFTIDTSLFSDNINISQTFHISIGNYRDADAVLDGADGFIVHWLASLLFGATVHCDPGCPTFLSSLAQLHCLPETPHSKIQKHCRWHHNCEWGGDAAKWVEHWVWHANTAASAPQCDMGFVSPRLNFQCRLSYSVQSRLSISVHVLKIVSFGSHGIVWTHTNAAHIGSTLKLEDRM